MMHMGSILWLGSYLSQGEVSWNVVTILVWDIGDILW
jgi:quinol-cytochrome oxidoreductase complex cytochrome b subunit